MSITEPTDIHSFSVKDAEKYGADCAVLLFNFRHWLKKNLSNKTNIREGRVWTYNSNKAFRKQFPYLSRDQIYRRLKKLEEDGILIKGEFNSDSTDRTRWYTIDEEKFKNLDEETDVAKSRIGDSENATSRDSDSATSRDSDSANSSITNNKTYNNTDKARPDGFSYTSPKKGDKKFDKVTSELPKCAENIETAVDIAYFLLFAICESDETHKYHNNAPSMKDWVKEIELTMRRDGRTPEQLYKMIEMIFLRRTRTGRFWKANIGTAGYLRDKFDTIKNQLIREKEERDRRKNGYKNGNGYNSGGLNANRKDELHL